MAGRKLHLGVQRSTVKDILNIENSDLLICEVAINSGYVGFRSSANASVCEGQQIQTRKYEICSSCQIAGKIEISLRSESWSKIFKKIVVKPDRLTEYHPLWMAEYGVLDGEGEIITKNEFGTLNMTNLETLLHFFKIEAVTQKLGAYEKKEFDEIVQFFEGCSSNQYEILIYRFSTVESSL
jgi:hypothetical protein